MDEITEVYKLKADLVNLTHENHALSKEVATLKSATFIVPSVDAARANASKQRIFALESEVEYLRQKLHEASK